MTAIRASHGLPPLSDAGDQWMAAALDKTHRLKVNPGGAVASVRLDHRPEFAIHGARYPRGRLLSRADIDAIDAAIATTAKEPLNMKIKDFKLGATGNFPRGSADATDEGELRLAIATDHQQGIVRVAFGTPVAWLGLPSKEARDFAAMLLEKADELDRRRA